MERFFSNFEFVFNFFEFLTENQFFFQKNRGMNIGQIAMRYIYISIYSSQRALQTNVKILKISDQVFEILTENQKFWPKTKKYSKE